jgi:integrase/recombinase XerD
MSVLKNPTKMEIMIGRYLEWIGVRGYAAMTVTGRSYDLGYFRQWCDERGITSPQEVTQAVLERYQGYLHYSQNKTKKGQKLSPRTQHLRVTTLKGFFKWLSKYNHILYNPARELELPKLGSPLPGAILTLEEIEKVMSRANLDEPLGIRDRAILETLYSTGIRRMELCNLTRRDLNLEHGFVMVREGKNNKDRVVPIGDRAISWIDKYLWEVRPHISPDPDYGIVFLTKGGKPFRPKHLTVITNKYVQAAQLGKSGSCHIFRHSMATLMLEGGADIRYIQQMLGHVRLNTTQIYTRVSVGKLKEIHTKTHPGATFKRTRGNTDNTDNTENIAAK